MACNSDGFLSLGGVMIKALLYPLVDVVNAFNVFQYLSFRSAYAAVTALLLAFLLGPWVIQKLTQFRIGQKIRLDGPRSHQVKAGTPTMGGLLIIIAFIISVLLWQDLSSGYVLIILITTLGFGLIGFLDDYLKIARSNSSGMRAGVKFVGQFIVALIVMSIIFVTRNSETTLLYLPFLKKSVLD
ncbi:MAG: phospho-N-acetylmuramoyl-pentapeptide-transferase, partial [spirochete symbiont of Stewartia floridana]